MICEYPPVPHLVVEKPYFCLVKNVTAGYIHCASLRSVFDVGRPRRATGQTHYVTIAYFKGLEGVGVKGVLMLREGRTMDRQVSRQLEPFFVMRLLRGREFMP